MCKTETFDDEVDEREKTEQNSYELEFLRQIEIDLNIKTRLKQEMTLYEYFEFEVFYEYEKAKRCIFGKRTDSGAKLVRHKSKWADNNKDYEAPFHPVFLSSLLNQMVHRRECYLDRQRLVVVNDPKLQTDTEKETRRVNQTMIDEIKSWLQII